MLLVYKILRAQIRPSEILVGILAPILIAPTVTWYLFGLIKELDVLEKEMRTLATYDQLTTLLTKRAFIEKATHYFNIARRGRHRFSILMVDLDHFKEINDTFGHIVGDHFLQKFGVIINQDKRETDLIGRYGGEEFIFLLWETDFSGVMQYTDKLHDKLRNMKLQHDGNNIQCTISIGVAYYSPSGKTQELTETIKQADNALYLAKKTGRNKTVV